MRLLGSRTRRLGAVQTVMRYDDDDDDVRSAARARVATDHLHAERSHMLHTRRTVYTHEVGRVPSRVVRDPIRNVYSVIRARETERARTVSGKDRVLTVERTRRGGIRRTTRPRA